ncbi:MAG: flavodoxin family protein [Candidatus Delongbacteria bacterium]|nr:flavodoxin family protein [Candidatus Delongbacteria bacterium]
MKITALVGSARKKHTYHATERFLQNLTSHGNVEYEIIVLSDYNLQTCRGCIACFDQGEEWCPLKDDRDKLIEKINNSDGVIFASPNYSFHVSAIMKTLLDRLGFIFHRPRYFGKTFTSIVAQGIYGGKDIVKYFNFIGNGLGFNVVKGSCITTLEPLTPKSQQKIEKIIDKHSEQFYSELLKNQYPTPSLLKLMMFRYARSGIKSQLSEKFKDYRYYKEKGWFESDYYYPVKLNLIKKLIGKFSDRMGTKKHTENQ